MARAGHDYIDVSGVILDLALRLDARAGSAPGHLHRTLVRMIAGPGAEPQSQATVLGFLARLWSRDADGVDRKAASSLLLRRLLSFRHDDYGAILRAVILAVRPLPYLPEFTMAWARANFIPDETIRSARRSPPGR